MDKFSKSFTGRRHAIGNTDDKSFSLIEGMFANPMDGGNIFLCEIFRSQIIIFCVALHFELLAFLLRVLFYNIFRLGKNELWKRRS